MGLRCVGFGCRLGYFPFLCGLSTDSKICVVLLSFGVCSILLVSLLLRGLDLGFIICFRVGSS